MKYFECVWQKNKCGGISCLYLKKKKKRKEKKRKRKRKIVHKENKKLFKFQFKSMVGGARRIAGELEFL